MFFVYSTKTQKVFEYKDLNSLLEGCENSHAMGDLFWTLGLKSWIKLSEVISDNLLKKRKFQFPALPLGTTTSAPSEQSASSTSSSDEPTDPAIVPPVEVVQAAPKKAPPAPSIPAERPPAPKAEEPDTLIIAKPEEDFKIISYEPPAPSASASQKPKDTKPINQRKSPRYAIRLKVIISNKEKTFLSYTSNVSIGGVALEDNIPGEYFADSKDTEIFISSPKKNEFLAFRCQPVGDDTDPKRFSFGQISEESLNKFQQWIDKLKT